MVIISGILLVGMLLVCAWAWFMALGVSRYYAHENCRTAMPDKIAECMQRSGWYRDPDPSCPIPAPEYIDVQCYPLFANSEKRRGFHVPA